MIPKRIVILIFLLVPLTAFLQPARSQLLSILKTYDKFQYLEYSFTYSSLDKNADTFYLENKGELQFTRFKSKSFYRAGGLNLDIYLSDKFISRKHFVVKCDLDVTTVHDIENSVVRKYEKMNNQLFYIRFKAHQIIPPLFLYDSSGIYNRRFFEKILSEKKLEEKDSLLSVVNINENYLNKYYRFEVSFRDFDSTKALMKWGKYFDKSFICGLQNKRFVIIIDRQSLLPVEILIQQGNNQFDAYQNIIINKTINNNRVTFNPYSHYPVPDAGWSTEMAKGKLQNWQPALSDKPAFDFEEVNCLSQEKIRLFDIKSEHIVLYIWNSQTAEYTEGFQQVCDFALKNPDKLKIIGLNNNNESNEYIGKIYKKYNWQFPTIKGREICKKFYISDTPAFVLIYKRGINFWISDSKFILRPELILSNVSD